MKNSFNVAIMGLGGIAEAMAYTLTYLEGVTAYAAASRSEEKAKAFAEKWGFTKFYGSYEELVSDDEVDLIYIATPHSAHYENAKLCINSGRNVLVEKSFCTNAKEAKQLLSLAKERGVFITEAIWTRYMPVIQLIRDEIASGTIGEVQNVDAEFSLPIAHKSRITDPNLAGGALLDLGMYCMTFASMYMGDDIAEMKSSCIKYKTGVDANDRIEITYKNGKKAFLKCCMYYQEVNEGKINGTGGYIHVLGLNRPEKAYVYDENGDFIKVIEAPESINGYEYEVLACKRAINAGEFECPEMPHAETVEIMEQMDLLRKQWELVYPFE